MRLYWNTIKLFCKTPSVIIPYLLLLAVDNIILYRLCNSFIEALHNPNMEADPVFFFKDSLLVCFLVFLFFIFISYEFMRKAKDSDLEEILRVRGGSGAILYPLQMLVSGTAALLHALNVTVYLLIGYFILNAPDIFVKKIFCIVLVNIFLLSLASLGIGFLISRLTNRFAGYAVMLGIIFLILPNAVDLLLDCQMNFHIPVFAVRDFLYLIPPDITAYPDPLYVRPIEGYQIAAMLFWVFLALLLCGWNLFRYRKKLRMVVSICMAGAILVTGYQVQNKGSVLLMDSHPESALVEKVEYNREESGKEEEVLFSVSAYDMNLSIEKELEAEVALTIEADQVLPEYLFTLYHGYQIKEITDDNGNVHSFQQDGDYVRVENEALSSVDTLYFHYKGHSPVFYSNNNACFLPGFFPYYPKPGYRQVYNEYIVKGEDTESEYRIRGLEKSSISSNLPEKNGVLEGKTDNVILLSGYYEETDVKGTSCVCYPLYPGSYEDAEYFLSDEMKQSVDGLYDFLGMRSEFDPTGKKVIIIPNSLVFNSVLDEYYECKDYILINGYQLDPYEILEDSLPIGDKEAIKEAFFFIKPNAETDLSELTLNKDEIWFDSYENDEISEFHDELVLKMRKLGVQPVARKVVQYLNDKENHTDTRAFLQSIEED